MTNLSFEQGVPTMPDVLDQIEFDQIVDEVGGDRETREIKTSSFIEFLMSKFHYTFELARDVIYALLEIGRATLTNRYTLKFAE